ncbi:MAG: acyl-CoA thioesterase [Bdellovibrionales bacterium]|nr:acyl-CoA thioesterase [Bdellovibrionales bacterium]
MKVHEYTTEIRERHLDTFGHVNNAQYLMLFEEARWEMITSRGYGLKEVHVNQVGTVVLECSVRFKKELVLREKITIRTWVANLRSRIATIHHELLKESGEIAAEANFVMGCFDLKARKLISPTREWLNAIGAETSAGK